MTQEDAHFQKRISERNLIVYLNHYSSDNKPSEKCRSLACGYKRKKTLQDGNQANIVNQQ